MDPISSAAATSPRPVFEDALGKRFHAVGPGGEPLELLEVRDDLANAESFESTLRERVNALTPFQNTSYARVRGVLRLPSGSLGVVSDRVPGVRLSSLLMAAKQQLLSLEINAALCAIRQLVPSVAMLHERVAGMAHGAIAPERIVITPSGRLVVVEHVLGSALEQLAFSHDRYWKDLRIALPKTAGAAVFDQRTDVTQVGAVALALILGRPLEVEEYPDRVATLAEGAWGLTASGGIEPLPAALRAWMARALQLDSRQAFESASDARVELDRALGTGDYTSQLTALKAFLADCTRYVAMPLANRHAGSARADARRDSRAQASRGRASTRTGCGDAGAGADRDASSGPDGDASTGARRARRRTSIRSPGCLARDRRRGAASTTGRKEAREELASARGCRGAARARVRRRDARPLVSDAGGLRRGTGHPARRNDAGRRRGAD